MGVELLKTKTLTEVTPFVPASAGLEPIAMRLFATPPPLGYTYRTLTAASGFDNWAQMVEAPLSYYYTQSGWKYVTLETLFNDRAGNAGFPIRLDWVPVYTPGGSLLGYMIPIFQIRALPRYYSPVANMLYVTFPPGQGQVLQSNGYPTAPGPLRGYMDVPTLSGYQRVWGNYSKDSRGVWIRTGGDPLPPYTRIGGTNKVVMLSDFPGRPSVPAQAATYVNNFNPGWNSGGDSVAQFNGNVSLRFNVDISGAGACGITPLLERVVGDHRTLSHCLYFDTVNGALHFCAMEYGRIVSARTPYSRADEFEIKRLSGAVTYLRNGATVHISSAPSGGIVRAGGSLFLADDSIGGPL